MNTTNKEKNQNKKSYNRIMNTSGINNINPNENNLSEIKVQNMKEEMNNIINNNTGECVQIPKECLIGNINTDLCTICNNG